MPETPLVSICCITYNHEKYIRDTIEGFLKQKTDFSIEIIIHDDASTDRTSEIVLEYKEKYPNLFQVVLQNENQYSKQRGSIFAQFVFPIVKGKYVALCEGDDYWTEPLKLQRQIDKLEKNPECDLCFHPVIAKFEHESEKNKVICQHSNQDKHFTTQEIILGGPTFCPTASLVIRRKVVDEGSLYQKAGIGFSYFLQIFAALSGGAIFIVEPMAVYRKMSEGSWNERSKNDSEMLLKHHKKILEHINTTNSITNKIYDKEFFQVEKLRIFKVLSYPEFSKKEKKEFFYEQRSKIDFSLKKKLILFFLKKRIRSIIKKFY